MKIDFFRFPNRYQALPKNKTIKAHEEFILQSMSNKIAQPCKPKDTPPFFIIKISSPKHKITQRKS